MSKKIIWILTISSTSALIGLIILQMLWVRDAVNIKEKQFSLLVNKTLIQVVEKIETHEAVNEISNELLSTIENQTGSSFMYLDENEIQNQFDVSLSFGKEVLVVQEGDSVNINSKITIFSDDSLIYKEDKFTNATDVLIS